MITRFLVFSFLIFSIVIATETKAQDSTATFTPEISYTGDMVSNLSGGIKTGTTYLGLVNLKLHIKLWKGGTLFFNGANTHGGEPSANLTGDLQGISNIEAGNHTYVQEFWFTQAWRKVSVTIGLQDLNIRCVNTTCGGLFLNSSFGIMPTISANIPTPIFPLTSVGIAASWRISEKTTLLASAFDGVPTDFADNPHNLKWHFKRNDGFLFFTELQRQTIYKGLPGVLKGGIYLHQHFLKNQISYPDTSFPNNNGIYILGEQEIWKGANKSGSMGLFWQLGLSPKKHNENIYYVGIGVNYYGPFNRNGNDILGIAVAHNGLRRKQGNETTFEISYRFPVFSMLYLQPDLQYIINPAGTPYHTDNSLAVLLRLGFCFP